MFPPTADIYQDVLNGSVANLIYAAALALGVLYALFLLLFQGLDDALGDLDINFGADVDSPGDVTGISMLAIASFVSSFGAFGLIAGLLFDASTGASLISALAGGLGMGLAAQMLWVYVLSPTVSSEVRQVNLIGTVAEIVTPIPPNGVGQIAFIAEGSRMTYSARATDSDQPIPRGRPVRIERIVGGVAYVSEIG